METREVAENIIQELIKTKVLTVDPQEYYTLEGLRKRYDSPNLDIRTVEKMIEDQEFPMPLVFAKSKKVWVKDEVHAWEDKKKAERFNQERLAIANKSLMGKSPSKSISA